MSTSYKASHPAVGPAAWKATGRPRYEGGDWEGGPAPFVGILDQLSTAAVGAWSVARRLTVNYEGALVRIRRSSDDAESDFGFDAGGELDTAAIAMWLGEANGLCVCAYDQSGNGRNMTQGAAGNLPSYTASGLGSRNRPAFIGASGKFLLSTDVAFSNLWETDGFSIHVAWKASGSPASAKFMLAKSTTLFQNWYFGLTDSIKPGVGRCTTGGLQVRGINNAETADASHVDTINSPVAWNTNPTWRRDGSARAMNLNGGVGTGSESDSASALAWPSAGTLQQPGSYAEAIIFASQISPDDLQALNDDASAFYGTV